MPERSVGDSKDSAQLQQRLNEVLDRVYDWSRQQGYKGYNKHDGLNSPILSAGLSWGKWPRLIAIQGVMRFPLNLRPLLLTPKTYNPKGLALFAQGLLDRYDQSGNRAQLDEAEGLLRLLLDLRSPGSWAGDCWGYHYPWQDLGFYAAARTPNAVVTAFVAEAFLRAYCVTRHHSYLEAAERTTQFFLKHLTVLKDEPHEKCLAYMPLPMTMRVMDVSILIGAVLAQVASHAGRSDLLNEAERLVGYVARRQTDYGAWFYTDPPRDSPIRHDNYHTGFILDALWRYREATGDDTWDVGYRRGLDFYAHHLFNDDGSPRWMSDVDYPHDIHGAAQGILTFGRHQKEYPGLANRIVTWALNHMYHPSGRFFYQQTRRYAKRFTLLRWCNAWMCRALASFSNSEEQRVS